MEHTRCYPMLQTGVKGENGNETILGERYNKFLNVMPSSVPISMHFDSKYSSHDPVLGYPQPVLILVGMWVE